MVYAAGNGHTECVRVLLEAGADVNARYSNELTALMWASAYGHVATVRFLLTRGADATLRDNRGKTAMMLATEEERPLVVAALREAGVSQ
jgi:ankyrin repeat protein